MAAHEILALGQGDGNQSQRFYVQDSCVIKSKPELLGRIKCTFYDPGAHDAVDDRLIISHIPVPEDALWDFLSSGKPPKRFVFILWREPKKGSSLVSEDDIELVDRELSIGNCVKRNPQDALGGTVIGAYEKLTLRPVFYSSINPDTGLRNRFSFTERLPQNSDQPSGGSQLDLPPILEDIPQEELVDADEFHDGDFVIYREKLGYIQEVNRGVVLVLPDGRIVSPKDPDEVELPVHAQAKTIVAIPNDSRLPVRKACNSKPFDFSIPAFQVRLGELLCTSENNLRQGTWISDRGISENIPTVGYLVSAPLIDVHVHWICSNVFHKRNSSQRYESSDDIIPAEAWREHAVVYGDGGSPPYTAPNHEQLPKISSPRLNLGDRVRFRDPAGAAVKYPNFHRIPTRDSFGYDLNVFECISVRSEYIVKWQDLTVTREKSTSLHTILNPELEYWPGELVCLWSENRKICKPSISSLGPPGGEGTNEWVFQPGKVGVVQTVNSRNRTMSVRWYENPQVTLLHGGYVLSPESTLGKLSNDIQEVSMYELSQYNALHRVHGEMVVIVPEKVKANFISTAPPGSNPLPATVGPCSLSYINAASIREVNSHLEKIRDFIVHTGWFQKSVKIDHISARPRHSIQRQEAGAADAIDWVGTIADTDVDGTIIVRLGGLNPYRDVKVPLEQILLIVDGEEDFKSSDSPTLSTGLTNELGSDVLSVLQQFLEAAGWEDHSELYPDEELWTTDEESETDHGESAEQPRGLLTDDRSLVDEILLEDIESLRPKEVTPIRISSDARGSRPGPPPRFQILESSPPVDHRYISENSTRGTRQRMRRINQEYGILETSLPDGIYVRTWESRLDLMRVVIIGPVGTPYEFAPFVIDMHLNESFPNQPPVAYFHSWTASSGSVNPNLFENGNICLSILGTWPSENENENWSQSKSTLLQILVSITGLVLVKEPFYNEAGFESFASDKDTQLESSQFNEKVFLLTRYFIKHALAHPTLALEDVLDWEYLPRGVPDQPSPNNLTKAISGANAMIEHYNSTHDEKTESHPAPSPFVVRLSLGAVAMLRRHVRDLEKILVSAEEAKTFYKGE